MLTRQVSNKSNNIDFYITFNKINLKGLSESSTYSISTQSSKRPIQVNSLKGFA